MYKRLHYISNNRDLNKFCELASKHNKDFPKTPFDQLIIAQHYGINTPLVIGK
jgi:hypothetical protein